VPFFSQTCSKISLYQHLHLVGTTQLGIILQAHKKDSLPYQLISWYPEIRTAKEKKTPDSRRKQEESGITGLGKQLEKQLNYLERLEQVIQSIRRLASRLDGQLEMVKEIASSVKQLQRQIIQVQKTIQKEKTRRK
jgi:hypothetical protein